MTPSDLEAQAAEHGVTVQEWAALVVQAYIDAAKALAEAEAA